MSQPRFWAKTGKADFENVKPKYHPVICHLADTAAVAMEIVEHHLSSIAVQRLCDGFGLSKESAIRFCGFMAGSHDLGKVSPAFQFQVSEVAEVLAGGKLYSDWLNLAVSTRQKKAPHGVVTAKTLPDFLVEIGVEQILANRLAFIVGGHHGFFPSADDINKLDENLDGTKKDGTWWLQKYSYKTFQQLLEFVGLTSPDLPTRCDNAATMILAGLTTVSDWIASNPDKKTGFPYISDDKTFEEYSKDLNQRAQDVLKAIGWTSLPTGKPLSFAELFPQIEEPRELQKRAETAAKTLTAPCLVLVEASMGEGKTEAAFYLADYMQQREGVGGFYVGLPTQATSNAMFERVKKFLGARYTPKEFPDFINLTLSHSAATLKEDYQDSVCRLDYQEQVYDNDSNQRVVPREWHTNRRRSLLSPYGVGTVDQALMGVLQSKWQFVRLFGLAGRTVIVDEIHAYDLYTGTLLERFVEWLALLGSPVIALSATLPSDTRKRLVNAYAKGCEPKPSKKLKRKDRSSQEVLEIPKEDYPRITTYTPQSKVQVNHFPPSSHVKRELHLHWVKDEEWLESLNDKLKDSGGCVAIICSTVGRAQNVFQKLKNSGYFREKELGLFHGRFLFADRERIERDCIVRFGEPNNPQTDRPHRYVLVATQVIEQSLDLDFDLMISDLAPVDLLLQRSGRLHRHANRRNRPAPLKQPTLWLIEPEFDETGKADFKDSGFIYDRYVLLQTWLTLRDRSSVMLPGAMDDLIEAVYMLRNLPPENLVATQIADWQDALEKHQQEQESYEDLAKKVYIPSAQGKHKPNEFTRREENDDDNTIMAVTRLGEESVTTIFLKRMPSGLILPTSNKTIFNPNQTPDFSMTRALLANSTRISKKGLVQKLKEQRDDQTKSDRPNKKWTSASLKYCCYVELDENNQTQIDKWKIFLNPERGVVINST
ncbi:CRISPR-associated helicase/endonuclease Cas3 [Leptolyngbya iicbica]|uniref:CRISPR-associated helicase/endonuclease Cas3 n=1 Tax=Lyngbya confervoides BDU141951 TaxID=1574623 RepID=A0A0C1V8I4_9CYAN